MRTLKVLSALLSYPTQELADAVPDIRVVLREDGHLKPAQQDALEPLLAALATQDVYELQEAYIRLFDRSRSLSLHLFEHVHGESRDRGQAMVDLKAVYEAAGLVIDGSELPDFVPLFLEYCSLLPLDQARALLAEPAHVLTALGERLRKKESHYAAVFESLVGLAATSPAPEAFEALLPEADVDPDDLQALDAIWQEEEVRFGPGAASDCGVDSLAAKLRQARRPAPGLEVPAPRPRTTFTHVPSRA
jgi:nitrate reductase delta subunit